jgi:hypothetical protein
MTNTSDSARLDSHLHGVPPLHDSDGQFFKQYNGTSFTFHHGLTENPLFDLSSLIEYARRLPADDSLAYWSNGAAKVDDRWDTDRGARRSLLDTIAHIADNDSLVLLKRVEMDAEYGPFLRDLLATIFRLVGPALSSDAIIGRATILIASPRRLTSYHIDADTNFLFQVHGDKKISVFDQTDRTLISDQELERYYSGDLNGATFKESRQQDARTYDLKPGLGVHIPCMAPHWAANSDNVSIALSINFDLYSIARLARIYKLNHRLRSYGLSPTPPGMSWAKDQMKVTAAQGLAAVRSVLRGRQRAAINSMR